MGGASSFRFSRPNHFALSTSSEPGNFYFEDPESSKDAEKDHLILSDSLEILNDRKLSVLPDLRGKELRLSSLLICSAELTLQTSCFTNHLLAQLLQ